MNTGVASKDAISFTHIILSCVYYCLIYKITAIFGYGEGNVFLDKPRFIATKIQYV